jgi:hypothetical protein
MGRYNALLHVEQRSPVAEQRATEPPHLPEEQTEQRLDRSAATLPTLQTTAPDEATQKVDDSPSESLLESVRKAVKLIGKEVTYIRLTPEEKRQMTEMVYTYKQKGIKTSENELGRIAINFLVADYRQKGETSVLARVLASLHT